ncbi:hypothetical protein CesoFtcFv8_010227 [Champsocephalus esox]|uniref:Uncharacterized protein n=3 Tax=Champsocephalus TaxID=52236 RepID=A0AAN8C7M2_9TELE|nr:hypothetical protein CesoFtcFv8_010227 [Champsocephalus esox]
MSIMSEVAHLPSMTPPAPGYNSTSGLLTTPTLLPWEHMQVHTILIVIMFCVVCFLLLLAFFYTFCFHCSISSIPKDSHAANEYSQEREATTYKCSSSDNQSAGNIV